MDPSHLRDQLLRVGTVPVLDRDGKLAKKGLRAMASTQGLEAGTGCINVDLANLGNLNLVNDPYQLDNQALRTERLGATIAEKRNTAVAASTGEHLNILQ